MRAGATIAMVSALAACFSEASDSGDDADDGAQTTSDPSAGPATDPSAGPTTAPTTGATDATTASTSTGATATTDTADTTADTTTTTGGSSGDGSSGPDFCPDDGAIDCANGIAVPGELCWLQPQQAGGGTDQLGELVLADVSGDGFVDMVASDGNDGAFVFVGDGTGLDDGAPLLPGTAAWSIDVGPVIPDGPPVVVVGGFDPVVWLIHDAGTAEPSVESFPVEHAFVVARLADMDVDGFPDIVAASGDVTTTAITVWHNDGAGSFGDPAPIELGADTFAEDLRVLHAVARTYPGLAILTQDGRLLLMPPSDAPGPGLEQPDPDHTFGMPTAASLAAGDGDGDGDTDLAVAYDGRAFVYDNPGASLVFYDVVGDPSPTIVAAALGDLDRDGDGDVVIAHRGADALFIYARSGQGFAAPTMLTTAANPAGVAMGTINDDCAADLVAIGGNWLRLFAANP